MRNIKNMIHSNNGFSLIEVLAAIVILTIVLTSFIGFFSQSIILSTQTEDELTAVNVAERILTQIKEDPNQIESLNSSTVSQNNRDYLPVITVIEENEHEEIENELGLQQVKIEVFKSSDDEDQDQDQDQNQDQDQPNATIFGYIEEGDGS